MGLHMFRLRIPRFAFLALVILWVGAPIEAATVSGGPITPSVIRAYLPPEVVTSNYTGSAQLSGTVTANLFSGSGASIGTLNASNLSSGTVASARISGAYSGITGVGTLTSGTWNGTTIAVVNGGTGSTTASSARTNLGVGTTDSVTFANVNNTGTVTANLFDGSGASLTNLNATNLSSGTVPNARVSGAYTGVTGLGTLTALQVDNLNLDANTISSTSGAVNITPLSGQNLNVTLGTSGAMAVNTNLFYVNTTNVGIGTTAPSSVLQVNTSGTNIPFSLYRIGATSERTYTASAGFFVDCYQFTPGSPYTKTTDLVANADSGVSSVMRFMTNNGSTIAEKMRIQGDGKVGIGTTAPQSLLDVRGDFITAGSTSSPSGSKILAGYYGDGALTAFGSEYSSGGPMIGAAVWPSTNATDSFISSTGANVFRGAYVIAGRIHKWTVGGQQTVAIGSPVTTTEVMRLDGSGRLGIGTSAPQNLLDVKGAMAIGSSYAGVSAAPSNGLIVEGTTIIGDTSTTSFHNGGGGTTAPKLAAVTTTITGVQAFSFDGVNNRRLTMFVDQTNAMCGFDLSYSSGSLPIVFQDSGTERMRISTTGKVGIGTSAPQNLLDVKGAMAIGSSYAGVSAAPSNGLIVEGQICSGGTSGTNFKDGNNVATQPKIAGVSNGSVAAGVQAYAHDGTNDRRITMFCDQTNAKAGFDITYSTGAIPIVFQNAGTELLRIASDGKVGIGTTSPSSTSLLDVNGNANAVNMSVGYTATATAAGTTTLTVSSTQIQDFTGSTTQTVTLPVVSTLKTGFRYRIFNHSSGSVTVQSSGGNTIATLTNLQSVEVICISASGTGTSSWTWIVSTLGG